MASRFEAFFKKDLARRLLLQRSSREAEHYAALLLREECGAAYTAGIEGMLKDMETSKALNEAFTSQVAFTSGPDFHVSVLTTGRWPSPPACEIALPKQLRHTMTGSLRVFPKHVSVVSEVDNKYRERAALLKSYIFSIFTSDEELFRFLLRRAAQGPILALVPLVGPMPRACDVRRSQGALGVALPGTLRLSLRLSLRLLDSFCSL